MTSNKLYIMLMPHSVHIVSDIIDNIFKKYNIELYDVNNLIVSMLVHSLNLLGIEYDINNILTNLLSLRDIANESVFIDYNIDTSYIIHIFKDIFSQQYNKNKIIIISGITKNINYNNIARNLYKILKTNLDLNYSIPDKNLFVVKKLLFKHSSIKISDDFSNNTFDKIIDLNNNLQELEIFFDQLIAENDTTTEDDNIVEESQAEMIQENYAVKEERNDIADLKNIVSDFVNKQEADKNKQISSEISELKNIVSELINKQQYVPEVKQTVSSYDIGQIGEKEIVSIIEKIRPDLEVIRTGSTGHLADIHVTDFNMNIKYIFEIKLKKSITQNDITKFNKDIEQAIKDNIGYKVVGIFISLNSDKIISIGEFAIIQNKIYLSNKYFSEQILLLIFEMITTYNSIDKGIKQNNTKTTNYVIPENVYTLITKLRQEYNDLEVQEKYYNNMLANDRENIAYLEELQQRLFIKRQFIKYINDEFSSISKQINDNTMINEELNMTKYIKETPKSKITKNELLVKFPQLKAKIGNMKLNDIIDKYKAYNIVDNRFDQIVQNEPNDEQMMSDDSVSSVSSIVSSVSKKSMRKSTEIKINNCLKACKKIILDARKKGKTLQKKELIEKLPEYKTTINNLTMANILEYVNN